MDPAQRRGSARLSQPIRNPLGRTREGTERLALQIPSGFLGERDRVPTFIPKKQRGALFDSSLENKTALRFL